ncbi:MAG: epimerase [Burkholderiaceae bacterium]|nr:epimerase [Burkholderiaceae bacterium]
MKVLIFGATGMLGQGLLRECLAAPDVTHITTMGRTACGVQHAKLSDITRPDLMALDDDLLRGPFDACFFVIGTTSAGLDEAAYTRVTYDLAMAVACPLARLNPGMTFVYGSGAGADSSEKSPVMWARVRGRLENDLARLPFKAVCSIRPGIIQPLHGARSKTTSYRVFYSLLSPLLPLARWLAPRTVLSTEIIGRAMLNIARRGAGQKVLESGDIWAAAQ